MKLPRREFLRLAGGAPALAVASRLAMAQSYPSRPLHFIVGFPSGGAADIVARVIGQWMSEQLGQSVIIENKPGAATNVALQAVLTAPADGYTFGYISSSATINASLYAKPPFQFQHDFAPVAGMVNYPHVLVVSHLIPQGVDKTLNVVEFYYPEEIAAFEPEFIEAERAAYMETAIEDDEIAERMDRGRLALYNEGRNEWGPYQSPMEDGMQHFHEFYRRVMGANL